MPDAGTVSFQVQGVGHGRGPAPQAASCTNVSLTSGSATCTFTPSSSGFYQVTVNYSGNALYLPSSANGGFGVN
jgi:hypothetical protein